jgi:phosphoribosylaminoimidazole-succinocarboxamide synthase
LDPLEFTNLPTLRCVRRGKVRDLYEVGDQLLVVATDRVSAFDVILSPGIPDKGKVLHQLSNFWFHRFADVENHLVEVDVDRFPPEVRAYRNQLAGRAALVRPCRVIPFECVARGYLAGSAFKEYRSSGSVCGIALPRGLREAEKLSEPIFTPATKSEQGHDINVSIDDMANAIGYETALRLRDQTLSLYERAARRCEEAGIILADSKVEFGERDGRTVWIDEAFTPDSSRFWPMDTYRPGSSPVSLDKQFIRDWLESTGWNKTPPAPPLPAGVVATTREKYLEAFRRLTGADPTDIS